ncbi:hypothetical protein PROFUN_04328 [Planoprotostelium fungivorum]|uniref:Uncharacterized protein n=1 Tax=Planoprotostelium fungivorum TaxID=1890364 RepID=A0A2P6NV53_9EUKA|nr:hypothetical protein PROFUN_04328 [Planoprotostelium fungivorum]
MCVDEELWINWDPPVKLIRSHFLDVVWHQSVYNKPTTGLLFHVPLLRGSDHIKNALGKPRKDGYFFDSCQLTAFTETESSGLATEIRPEG